MKQDNLQTRKKIEREGGHRKQKDKRETTATMRRTDKNGKKEISKNTHIIQRLLMLMLLSLAMLLMSQDAQPKRQMHTRARRTARNRM